MARAIALIGLATCATLMIILTYAVWEWHIWILRIGSYIRVYFEETAHFPSPVTLNGPTGWLSRSRDAGCNIGAESQHWLYSRAASDALIVALAAVWFIALAGAGLSFMATRPSLRGEASSPPLRMHLAWIAFTLPLLIAGFEAFVAVDRLPLRIGIVAAVVAVPFGVYRMERLDAQFYWHQHPWRSLLLCTMTAAACASVLHMACELANVKDAMPEMEAEWRCLKATETHNDDEKATWCSDPSARPRKSYLGEPCSPMTPKY
jgi:hypothetical protein